MKTFLKTISFLDANNHRANLDIEITERNGYPEFTVSGQFLGSFGQCLDEIKPKGINQNTLINLWKEYHLKDVSQVKNFYTLLIETIENIEKEEKEKVIKDTIEQKMEEWGIDESQKEACEAYLECMGEEDLKDFEECYCGEFTDDEEFAREQAESLGLINNDVNWPNNCIDWEKAARELMMDYTEQDGYYFRNY